MIYIKTDNSGVIIYQNNFPFHEKWGLGKTEEELLQEGFLVDSIPEAPYKEGKNATTKYIDGEFIHEYTDVINSSSIEEELEQVKAQLKATQQAVDFLLTGGM